MQGCENTMFKFVCIPFPKLYQGIIVIHTILVELIEICPVYLIIFSVEWI